MDFYLPKSQDSTEILIAQITLRNAVQEEQVTLLRSELFWGNTERRVVVLYGRFGTTYRSHLQTLFDP
jgi:hypothetical protein